MCVVVVVLRSGQELGQAARSRVRALGPRVGCSLLVLNVLASCSDAAKGMINSFGHTLLVIQASRSFAVLPAVVLGRLLCSGEVIGA